MSRSAVDRTTGEFFDSKLHVVECAECERLRNFLTQMQGDIDAAEIALRAERRHVQLLKAQLGKQRRESPNHKDAKALFEYWQAECGHPRAKFGQDREKALLKALQDYTPRELALAILGAKHAANVSKLGVRYDDLTLIVRDSSHVEEFIARYQAWREKRGLEPADPGAPKS